jgi:hypothetical protein
MKLDAVSHRMGKSATNRVRTWSMTGSIRSADGELSGWVTFILEADITEM